jgi:hypothetical protein
VLSAALPGIGDKDEAGLVRKLGLGGPYRVSELAIVLADDDKGKLAVPAAARVEWPPDACVARGGVTEAVQAILPWTVGNPYLGASGLPVHEDRLVRRCCLTASR